MWRWTKTVKISHAKTRRREGNATTPAQLFRQQIEINLLVASFQENGFATIAALRHAVRNTRNRYACSSGHDTSFTNPLRIVQ
ncbi:hypothetical protein ABAC402_16730 [Asticcacaulis sp. AC402]|nr:hypothetical protein ABAC402_16730 [Asticcacaulis sp. AC402]